jgi:mannose-6-phosphate isomerase-like protein (cupin superfamily)
MWIGRQRSRGDTAPGAAPTFVEIEAGGEASDVADATSDEQQPNLSADDARPIFLPLHTGKVLDFLGVTHRLTSEQSGGSIYIFESAFAPRTGNRLHVHSREDEFAYVLEGALEVRLRDRTAVLEAGGVSRLPKTVPHALRNPLETPSRYLFLAVPGGLDRWFDALVEAKEQGSLDETLSRTLSEAFGIEWLE